jgi:AcrR family transcriptional regulator
MPRPRFDKLEPEKREAILKVAAQEFAEHGYEAASYNRIIERSGLSKGAIYYYFDDKEDLYTTVLRDAMQRLVLDMGNIAAAKDAGAFWWEFEIWYVLSLRAFQEDPHAVGLARSLVKAMSRGTAGGVLAELRAFSRAFMDAFIDQGHALGAVRSDVPRDLLVSVLMAVEEGIDLWLGERVGGMSDGEIGETAVMLTRLYRGIAAPPKKTPTPTTTKKKTTKKRR